MISICSRSEAPRVRQAAREIFIEAASGLLNCDRYGKSSFSTQSAKSGHSSQQWMYGPYAAIKYGFLTL
jgi:hypothetical protein